MRLSGKKSPFPGISRNTLTAFTVAMLMAACGGGGGDAPGDGTSAAAGAGSAGSGSAVHAPQSTNATGHSDGQSNHVSTNGSATSPAFTRWTLNGEADVSRFMAQASFGARDRDLKDMRGRIVNDWIESEFSKPQTKMLAIVDQWKKERGKAVSVDEMHSAWWYLTQQDDQLRQRIAYSLSQIFVVSSNSGTGSYVRGMANYYDILARHAFGNFRDLLEDVSVNPMMGIYLTHIFNRKESFNSSGDQISSPDENFAREVMQLFTIGLEMLNPDGTLKLDARGKPIPTYNNDDILGLARVFTGWGWAGGRNSYDCFHGIRTCDITTNPDRELQPMRAYPAYHSTMEKRFLGVTIPEGQETPVANLKIALDTLFNHPNVGPFIGKQLIQRLVTSNPSPAYVQRVTSAFNNNGQGVRGDMKAVIRAILLDPEARQRKPNDPSAGRIREPILRLAHVMRAFEVKSLTGHWRIYNTDTAATLNQTTLRSPSVFNFYRPGFSPANSPIGNAGLVAPEMQIMNESSLAGFSGFIDNMVGASSSYAIGIGAWLEKDNPLNPVKTERVREMQFDYSRLVERAPDAESLVDYLDKLLMAGQMRSDTRRTIVSAISRIEYPIPKNSTPERVRRTNLNRAGLAVYLSLMSPDYTVLR